MPRHRTHIVLPDDLIAEIDSAVGPRRRNAFLVESARAELRRRNLLAFLRSDQPAWQEQDHPELKSGAAAWVRKLRKETDASSTPAKRRSKRS